MDTIINMEAEKIIENKIIMVTGGAGFIGSHLITKLLTLNPKKIYAVDSMEYGNLDNLPKDDKLEFIKFNIGSDDISQLSAKLKECDYLFHLAAQKHNQSISSPHVVYESNIIGTSDLFDLAGQSGVKKIIFSSSLYAHGSLNQPAMKESDVPMPKTIYGISKLCGERLLDHFGSKYNFEFNSLRFFFVYGPKQFPGMGYKSVIIKNFERIIAGEAPVIFGDGKQSLDYIYIDDVIDVLILTLAEAKSGELFHLGSGQAPSINELTKIMMEVSSCDKEIKYEEADWTAGTSRQSDISKIKKDLNWSPKVSLKQGLSNTYNWLKGQ